MSQAIIDNLNKRIHIEYYNDGQFYYDEGLLKEYSENKSLVIERVIGGRNYGRKQYNFYLDDKNYIYQIEDNNCAILYKNNEVRVKNSESIPSRPKPTERIEIEF